MYATLSHFQFHAGQGLSENVEDRTPRMMCCTMKEAPQFWPGTGEGLSVFRWHSSFFHLHHFQSMTTYTKWHKFSALFSFEVEFIALKYNVYSSKYVRCLVGRPRPDQVADFSTSIVFTQKVSTNLPYLSLKIYMSSSYSIGYAARYSFWICSNEDVLLDRLRNEYMDSCVDRKTATLQQCIVSAIRLRHKYWNLNMEIGGPAWGIRLAFLVQLTWLERGNWEKQQARLGRLEKQML